MRRAVLLFALSITATTAPAVADGHLTPAERLEIVHAVSGTLQAEHFDPATREAYRETLAAWANSIGSSPTEPDAFALALHRALQANQPDGHLGIYGPDRTRAILGLAEFEGIGHDEPASDDGHGTDQHGAEAASLDISVLDDGGVLWRLEEFSGGDGTVELMRSTLAALETPDYLVLDLRDNRGGDAALFRHLAGCLFPKATDLFAIDWREGDGVRTAVSRAEPSSECGHLATVPVVVVVDGMTASTAELAAFALQVRERAVVVGERTYGASHPAEFFRLPHGFGAMIPIGRAYEASSGRDWEGTGVLPDLAAGSDEAVRVATEHGRHLAGCRRVESVMPGFDCEVAVGPEAAGDPTVDTTTPASR